MGQKKDIKLVKSLLNDKAKRKLYSEEEIIYMQLWLKGQRLDHARRKAQRKAIKGFGQ